MQEQSEIIETSENPTLLERVGEAIIVPLMLAIIALWAFIIASLDTVIGALPMALQLIIYAVAGIIWILPMKPLLLWMETGRWRVPSDNPEQ